MTYKLDGLDDALLGFSWVGPEELVAVYSYERCIEIFMTRDGMTYGDAIEYMDFNVVTNRDRKSMPLMVHTSRYVFGDEDAE
jgi:hypothetical protein